MKKFFFLTASLVVIAISLLTWFFVSDTASEKPATPIDMFENMIKIPAGEFGMGCSGPDNPLCEKQYKVVMVDDFYIDRFEVGYKQYRRCVKAKACRRHFQWNTNSNMPAQGLSQHDAQAFCRWAGKRLPTSAEWEKAARGIEGGHRYPWGDKWQPAWANWCDGGNCDGSVDGFAGAAPVNAFPENLSPYGVQNMCGNMLEWTSTPSPEAGPDVFIVRGGSYRPPRGMGDPDGALIAWVASTDPADVHPDHMGVRCAYSAPVTDK